jgi:radical SAM-linked protein
VKGDNGFPVRMRYSKRGKVRFVGHRDVARGFERAFRIVGLPLSFTLGFSPRPKVSFGLALSVGHESDAEFLDVELSEPIDLEGLPEALTAALPEGIVVTGVAALADRAPALQEAVTAVDWQLEVTTPDGDAPEPIAVARLVATAMAAPSLHVTRTRKGREADEDIRPALRRIAVLPDTEHGALLEVEVSTQPVSVRAGELLAALGGELAERRVLRTGQWIERGGARLEPLAADPRRAVEARAS